MVQFQQPEGLFPPTGDCWGTEESASQITLTLSTPGQPLTEWKPVPWRGSVGGGETWSSFLPWTWLNFCFAEEDMLVTARLRHENWLACVSHLAPYAAYTGGGSVLPSDGTGLPTSSFPNKSNKMQPWGPASFTYAKISEMFLEIWWGFAVKETKNEWNLRVRWESLLCHTCTLLFEFCFQICRKNIRLPCEHEAPQDKKTDRARDGHGHFLSDWRKLPASGKC